MKPWSIAIGVPLLLVLAGCSGLRGRGPETVSYVLRAPAATAPTASTASMAATAPTAATTPTAPTATTAITAAEPAMAPSGSLTARSLKVMRVVAQPGYDDDRILLLGADRSLGHFAASRWVEPLPAMVGTLAVEMLRGTAALRSVLDEAAPFGADYGLRLTIRRFDAEYPLPGAPPRVTVSFDCAVARADRTILGSFVVQAQAESTADRMGAVVAAFEQATGQALGESVQRTLTILQAANP